MKSFLKFGKLLVLIFVFLFACQDEQDMPTPIQQDDLVTFEYKVIPGRYIVVLNEDVEDVRTRPQDYQSSQVYVRTAVENLLSEKKIDAEIDFVFSNMIRGFTAEISDEDLPQLMNDERVKYVERDHFIIMGKPPWAGGGDDDGGSPAEETPPGITRVNGGVTYTGNNVAWILDTGIDLDHEDLNVDGSRGFNAFSRGRDGKSLDDGNGHGTHVSGTVAAIDNEVGVVGVAAGATVIPVKVLDSRGSGSYSGVIAGVDFVGANGSSGDVANMSLGGPPSQALDDAILAASANGIQFCLAAGNDGDDANNYSPARVNGSDIVTISAMDANDDWAYFSNYGNPPVDYCAPGVSIKSTWKDGGYNTISGTSMATPHSAGVLLLGNAGTDGTVNGDPDGDPDPIIVH